MARDPIDPGETLQEGPEELGMSTDEPARRIDVPVNRITEILKRRHAVTGNMALCTGRFFGTSGKFRLNPRKFHELRFAERSTVRGSPVRLRRTTAIGCTPRVGAPRTGGGNRAGRPLNPSPLPDRAQCHRRCGWRKSRRDRGRGEPVTEIADAHVGSVTGYAAGDAAGR